MSKPVFLALDTETGGIGHDKALLSAYFMVLDADLNPIDSLDLFVKPDDGIYAVTAEALGINKINLVEHEKKAITYKAAGTQLYEFLQRNNAGGESKLVMLGHNAPFDSEFLKAKIISGGTWNKFVSYSGALEVGGTIRFLKTLGLIPEDLKGGLGSIAKYLEISNEDAHSAKGDVLMCVAIMRALREKYGMKL